MAEPFDEGGWGTATGLLDRPAPTGSRTAPGPRPPREVVHLPRTGYQRLIGDGALTVLLGLLLATAIAPLSGVYLGSDWIRPVGGALLLALGLAHGARRMGLGPLGALGVAAVGWALFVAVAFESSTLLGGIVPTRATAGAVVDAFARGFELVRLRPSPTFAEPGLLLLTVTGVWIVAYLADGMLFILRSPTKAIVAAITLWAVPLAVAPSEGRAIWPWAGSLLLASAVLLLGAHADDVQRSGHLVLASARPARGEAAARAVAPPSAVVIGGAAVLLGVLLAGLLPGFDAEPWFEVRGAGGTTITTNPIVDIRARLVATDTGPVVHVDSPRPVYLRTTSLDVYNDREEWTSSGIRGTPVQGDVAPPPDTDHEQVEVGIEISGIEPGAILAPAPFQPIRVTGPTAEILQYDRTTATLTVDSGEVLEAGDTYQVTAALPAPSPAVLRQVARPAGPNTFVELPPNVPPEVGALAREIVTAAGAETMFDQALAIQDELRTWTYSLTPAPGHGSTAMLQFLDSREGYCEQFAGTMAVMLRSLGIPARLAVGYTPGTVGDDGRWTVSNANAHAWVEVHFGPHGWIPFEPTPRTDGNVLVPGEDGLAPDRTERMEAEQAAAGEAPLPGAGPQPEITDPFAVPEFPDVDPGAVPAGGGTGGGSSLPVPVVVLAMVAVVAVLAAVVLRARQRGVPAAPPPERIRAARVGVERLGRAIGRPRRPGETDAEYFPRLAGGHSCGAALAGPATRADFAPAVEVRDARAAESAAADLESRLLTGLSRAGRVRVRLSALLRR